MRSRHFVLGAMFVAMLPGLAVAQERLAKSGAFNPDHRTVEFFQAMKDGQLDVKFIPESDAAANVLIENKTDKPLNVKLPEAFAGAPVLAQWGGGGRGGMGGGGGGGQGMGGGMGGGGGGMGGMGGGGGVFNVAPEKVGKIRVACVCLDHGKPDPTPRMAYKIVPAEEYIQRPAVIELMKLFGQGKLDRSATQAATWHLNNDLSWQELANKKIFSRKYPGGSKPYFQPGEVQLAYRLALYSQEKAKDAKPASPGSESRSPGVAAAELRPIVSAE